MNKPVVVYCLSVATLVVLNAMSCGSSDDDALDCPRLETADALVDLEIANRAVITGATLEGDCLRISGTYGGGCVADDLRAVAQQSALKVYPPIYVVTLFDAADDACEALESGEATFSIRSIRDRDAAFQLRFEGLDELVMDIDAE